ncbi:hypothetical protein EZ428_07270 [Pedobacter frigiditerrae]|uniref:Uncharacterized protein n=1 Tax=Pedobacter frigiditerrae TaxID=2530452 RepID=A0A4R0MXF5_9SPHI|nr:hypothetical protein [Pedobacter frigiditerrae]TCC91557.1 hypothetical protein EZ428_07270 [Pedobacter frigiditerrae]
MITPITNPMKSDVMLTPPSNISYAVSPNNAIPSAINKIAIHKIAIPHEALILWLGAIKPAASMVQIVDVRITNVRFIPVTRAPSNCVLSTVVENHSSSMAIPRQTGITNIQRIT